MIVRLVYSVIGFVALYAIYALVSYVSELQEFKQSIIEQTQALQVQAERQSNELKHSLSQAQISAVHDIGELNRRFDRLVNERVRIGSASGEQVRTVATASASVEQASTSKPSRASGELSQKLLRCEARLLYEAKEYDILATHYNVLLQTYEQARLLNGTKESKQK